MNITIDKIDYDVVYVKELDKTFLDMVLWDANNNSTLHYAESWFGFYAEEFKQEHFLDMLNKILMTKPKDFKLV